MYLFDLFAKVRNRGMADSKRTLCSTLNVIFKCKLNVVCMCTQQKRAKSRTGK